MICLPYLWFCFSWRDCGFLLCHWHGPPGSDCQLAQGQQAHLRCHGWQVCSICLFCYPSDFVLGNNRSNTRWCPFFMYLMFKALHFCNEMKDRRKNVLESIPDDTGPRSLPRRMCSPCPLRRWLEVTPASTLAGWPTPTTRLALARLSWRFTNVSASRNEKYYWYRCQAWEIYGF